MAVADGAPEPERPAATDPVAQPFGALEAPVALARARQHFAGAEREQRGDDLVGFRGLAHAITSASVFGRRDFTGGLGGSGGRMVKASPLNVIMTPRS